MRKNWNFQRVHEPEVIDFQLRNLSLLAHEPAESSNSFSFCVLGWAPTNNELKFPRDIAENSHQFMILCYNLGKYWLQSHVILPDKRECIQNSKNYHDTEDLIHQQRDTIHQKRQDLTFRDSHHIPLI